MAWWAYLLGMASTHQVNISVMSIHIWPPALASTWAQQCLEAPLLEIWVLGFFHIHTVQTTLVLSAAGPVFPTGPVLASSGCSCLADRVGNFFPAPSKALVAASTQPSTAQLQFTISHASSFLMLWDVLKNSSGFTLASGSVILYNSVYSPIPSPLQMGRPSLFSQSSSLFPSVILGYLFFPADGLFRHRYIIKPNGQKTTFFSVPHQHH